MDDLVNKTVQYHETTKHHFNRYASSPGYLDWANQPDPFRRFNGADLFFLPPMIKDTTPSYASLFSGELISPKTFDIEFISRLFEMAMGVTAWKQAGDSRWALRANPSSGNLHPTEAYLISPGLKGLNSKPGLYHYCPKEHGLELRTEFSEDTFAKLSVGFPKETFFVGLSSIHWREAWKYGERAFRYCQHDTGHALASVRIAVGALGWRAVHLEGMNDEDVSHLLGLDRDDDFKEGDREHPDLILAIFPYAEDACKVPLALDVEAIKEASGGSWNGFANRLSGDKLEWDIIDRVSETSLKKNREGDAEINIQGIRGIDFQPVLNSSKRKNISTRQIVRQRRSAVSFDGHTGISKEEFYCVLSHTTIDEQPGIPWDAICWKPSVHLFLFVHRVTGIEPGLYFLARSLDNLDQFKSKFKSDFEWTRPADCPEELNLFLLTSGDFKRHAAQVSCGQDIAGDSAFSLGMIAEIQSSMETFGPSQYRRLFWESGMIGQNLYLAAEFMGLRGTGIGCYFDDPVRELLGVKDSSLESFYHFTIGGPVDDSRLQTHAPYIWTEEISLGKCDWDNQSSKNESPKEEVVKNSRSVQWDDKWVSKIGMGLRGMNRYRNSNIKALNAVLKTSINVFETSPDETDGEDEWLLGNTLSKLNESEPIDRNDLFIVTRGGWVRGKNLRVVEELKKRGNLQAEIRQLNSEINLCLTPEFLRDQIERSLYRLGINYLDLFLLRMPLYIEKEQFDEIGDAFSVLEELCKEGKIKRFGLTIFELEDKEISFTDFPLEVFCEKSPYANGFQAIEVAGNFINKRSFESEPGKESFVERANGLSLKVIAGNPLKAQVEDKAFWLVDYFENSSWEETAKELSDRAKNLEIEIQETPLADNRTLEEAMRDARIRSPFNFSQTFSFYLEKKEPTANDYTRLQEATSQSLSMAKTVRDQLANAKLLPSAEFEETLSDIETLFDNILSGFRCYIRSQINTGLKEFRDSNLEDGADNLQTFGMNWLFEQGADIVLNKISHPEYLDDALSILKKK